MDALTFLAFSPILLIVILLLVFRKPLLMAAPVTFLYTLILALAKWDVVMVYAKASIFRGFLVAVDITFIIFGAIFFLEFLKRTKIIDSIEAHLSSVSPDRRIQAIILCWFLVSFIEGTAGFGTPAAIVAPLLVALGFPAVTAVALALIGDSASVIFGAVGTPIRVGFAGLDVMGVAFYAGLITLFIGVLVPIMILWVLVKSRKDSNKGDFKEVLPFAVYAGFAMTVPFFLLTYVGQEFPSLVAPLIGLLIVVYTTKKGFLVPKNVMRFGKSTVHNSKKSGLLKSFFPYALLVVLLIIGKFVLKSYPVKLLGVVNHSINFYNPGFFFILTIVLVTIFFRHKIVDVFSSASDAVKVLIKPLTVIFFITAFVQIMVHSGNNWSGFQGMIAIIAEAANTRALPFVAPFIGVFGAFIAGSATVSNLLFGQFQASSASILGFDVAIILSLQIVGAGIGNMIALTNIVAAQATVKLHGEERAILRRTFWPAMLYAGAAGLFGLILIYLL